MTCEHADPYTRRSGRVECRTCIRVRQQAWKEKNRERIRATGRAWRAANRERKRANNKAWQEANPEKHHASQRKYDEANRERVNEKHRLRRAANPGAEYARRRAITDPEVLRQQGRDYERIRRERKARILLVVRVESDACGVCFAPLTSAPWPDPMMTTQGHEPPLARAVRDGWRVVALRPEHLRCNQRKSIRTDAEAGAFA